MHVTHAYYSPAEIPDSPGAASSLIACQAYSREGRNAIGERTCEGSSGCHRIAPHPPPRLPAPGCRRPGGPAPSPRREGVARRAASSILIHFFGGPANLSAVALII